MKKYAPNLPTTQPYNAGRTSQTKLPNKYAKKYFFFSEKNILISEKICRFVGPPCVFAHCRTDLPLKIKKKEKSKPADRG